MRFLGLTIILLCSGLVSDLDAEDSSTESVRKRSSEKLSRIRSLFAKLKAMRARERGEVVPVQSSREGELPISKVSENLPTPGSDRKDFDHFLFSDENDALEPGRVAPSEISPVPKVEVVQGQLEELLPMEVVSPPAETAEEMRYVVQPGDALLLIARKVYRDPGMFKAIMKWNDLKSVNIFPNQVLNLKNVPKVRQEEIVEARKKDSQNLYPPQSYRYKVYKVGYGDSLARIAHRFLGSQKKYMNLAQLNDLDPNKYLFVGQKMIIPVAKQVAQN